MDEEQFRKYARKKSVFKQQSSLDLSFVPLKLYHRDDAVQSLIINFRRILDEAEPPSINYLIKGKGGVGKTVTSKFFGRHFRTIATEADVNVFIEYYNCINFSSKSKIIRELLAKHTHGSGRGYSDDEALKLILTKLNRNQEYMLLIIDEISELSSDEILALLDIAETFGHQNAKLSILLISRPLPWMRRENEKIASRINHTYTMGEYNFEESVDILTYRSDLAFKENVINADIIELISQIVVESKNMRHGISILRTCGNFADQEGFDHITSEMVRRASEEVYPEFRDDLIDLLDDHELLTLYGITKALMNSGEAYTVVDEAYEEYEVICENYSIPPHVKMTFRKYVRNLNSRKVVSSKTVRIEGAQRGRHLEITLIDIPAETLEEHLSNLIERKFGE